MKSLAPHDRPREKLDRYGSGVLGGNELLAVILGHGFHRKNALDIANRVLGMSGGVHGLTRLTEGQLRRVPGVGPAKAVEILAAVELGRRTRWRGPRPNGHCSAVRRTLQLPAAAVWRRIGQAVRGRDARYQAPRASGDRALGGDARRKPDPPAGGVPRRGGRESRPLVLFHNHPSGDPTPSADDVVLTARLVEAGALLGIEVVDHLVLGTWGTTVSKRRGGSDR